MKKQSIALLIGLTLIMLGARALPAAEPEAKIIKPVNNEKIKTKGNIQVVVSIPNYEKETKTNRQYFWVSFANMDDEGNLINHWPKFYVKSDQKGIAYEGGHNPLPEPQPMMVLLLKVDADANQHFTEWLKEGLRTGDFPGLNIDKDQIVAQQRILLP